MCAILYICRATPSYSFVDYLRGGCEINLIVAIDFTVRVYLIQNSQAVKKVCGPQKGYGEKRCEIQGGGQEMAVMVG